MKAFLSHSSKDKHFVEIVYRNLGEAVAELDSETFDAGELSVQSITSALDRCSLFVLFLSKESAQSPFVQYELFKALNDLAAGTLKRVIVISLDQTAHNALPEIARNIVTINKIHSPKVCARRIQSYLFETQSELDTKGIFIGRDRNLSSVKSELAKPGETMPRLLAVVGQDGIGRRTFAQRAITDVLPFLRPPFPVIRVRADDTADDIFRALFQNASNPSIREFIDATTEFSQLDSERKRQRIAAIVRAIRDQREIVVFVDDGGILNSEGRIQHFLPSSEEDLPFDKCPYGILILNRMPPPSAQRASNTVFFERLQAFEDPEMRQLASYHLKAAEIRFDEHQLQEISKHLDGHPINLSYAIANIKQYGVEQFLSDTKDFVLFKHRRAKQYLDKIKFDFLETKIIGVLSEYKYLSLDLLYEIFGTDAPSAISNALRVLEDRSVVERQGHLYHISSPLRVGIEREDRFELTKEERAKYGAKILKWIKEFQVDEAIPFAIIEAGVYATIQSQQFDRPEWLSRLILPSHLYRLAKDAYDKRQHQEAAELCEKATANASLMTPDGCLNLYRLHALCLARLMQFDKAESVRQKLKGNQGKLAQEIYHFLGGFFARLRNDFDTAETEFLEAIKAGPRNFNTLRELAQLYLRKRSYTNAESYARRAFELAPTNPYIIDMLVEVLIQKSAKDHFQFGDEINGLMKSLLQFGDDDGVSFYLARMADIERIRRNYVGALEFANRAVGKTPRIFSVYKERAKIYLALKRFSEARADIEQMKKIANDLSTGEGKGGRAELDTLEFNLYLESGDLKRAKEALDRARMMPRSLKIEHSKELAVAISTFSNGVDPALRDWAHDVLVHGTFG